MQSRREERDTVTEKVYNYIVQYVRQHTYPPSLNEISRHMYMSRSGILRYLDILEGQGRIKREPGQARSITLVELVQPGEKEEAP